MVVRIPVKQTGLTLGILFGLAHLAWVAVIASGMGRAVAEWKMSLHFVTLSGNAYYVQPFNAGTAVIGVVGALVVGFVIGAVFAIVWNWGSAMQEGSPARGRRRR